MTSTTMFCEDRWDVSIYDQWKNGRGAKGRWTPWLGAIVVGLVSGIEVALI
ncbi:hypothetical protein RchiOBHm_Chr3g0462251 [Rosa chinensis]|uniref:Uncharacterized protein n=1 Tax=Rosa chinensis TaxID=74649 RepID=A0A2P6R8V1_ROSCH|nr:hypothetical protein RchiOBHm_Chr3g0462251 [Rosa chinensis]